MVRTHPSATHRTSTKVPPRRAEGRPHGTGDGVDLIRDSVRVALQELIEIEATESHIETWVKSMSAKWAPTTIKTRFVIVRSVFRAAVADRVIASDPTVEQVAKLLAHADSNRVSARHGFRAYVALCAFAGLRKGEAAGVQVGDIDFSLRRLTFRPPWCAGARITR